MNNQQVITERQDLIFIVDDNKNICAGIKRLLGLAGLHARYVTSPREALDLLPSINPKVLLLDVMMPEMSGIELLRIIRANPITADIPVVMMTATSDEEDFAEVRRLGVREIIIKGKDDWSQFVTRMRSYLA